MVNHSVCVSRVVRYVGALSKICTSFFLASHPNQRAAVLGYESNTVKPQNECAPIVASSSFKAIPQLMRKTTGCSIVELDPALWAVAFRRKSVRCQRLWLLQWGKLFWLVHCVPTAFALLVCFSMWNSSSFEINEREKETGRWAALKKKQKKPQAFCTV